MYYVREPGGRDEVDSGGKGDKDFQVAVGRWRNRGEHNMRDGGIVGSEGGLDPDLSEGGGERIAFVSRDPGADEDIDRDPSEAEARQDAMLV